MMLLIQIKRFTETIIHDAIYHYYPLLCLGNINVTKENTQPEELAKRGCSTSDDVSSWHFIGCVGKKWGNPPKNIFFFQKMAIQEIV